MPVASLGAFWQEHDQRECDAGEAEHSGADAAPVRTPGPYPACLDQASQRRAPSLAARRYAQAIIALAYESPNRMGLINLNGRVIAPQPNRPWREKPNAGGERRR